MSFISIGYDDARLRAWAQQSPLRARRATRIFLLRAGQLARREMVMVARERFGRIGVRHPGIGPPTGALAASIRATRGPNHVDVGPNVPYAEAVDTGSKPHIIRPKNARALSWRSKFAFGGKIGRSGVHFAKAVQHPGFKGHEYVLRTAERVSPKLAGVALAAFEKEMLRR